jgi:hypothetical protein
MLHVPVVPPDIRGVMMRHTSVLGTGDLLGLFFVLSIDDRFSEKVLCTTNLKDR